MFISYDVENQVGLVTSWHTEDGLEPKLAQSLQDIVTDKCFSGHLDSTVAAEDITA